MMMEGDAVTHLGVSTENLVLVWRPVLNVEIVGTIITQTEAVHDLREIKGWNGYFSR